MSKVSKHPAFPQPKSDRVSLWRYMAIDKFEWMVENERLFIPSSDRLGDPWEGRTPQGYIDWWNQELQNAGTDEQRATIVHNRDFLFRISQAFQPHYYVTCWHMNEHENYAMWRCYTATNEAVAIKTSYGQLARALPEYAFLGLVRYIDYSMDKLPSMNLFEYITHKDKFFQYEQEVRGVILPAPENTLAVSHFKQHHFELDSVPGFRVFAPPIDCAKLINSIVLHPGCNDLFQVRMNELCSKYSLPSPDRSRQSKPHAI